MRCKNQTKKEREHFMLRTSQEMEKSQGVLVYPASFISKIYDIYF